MILSVRAAIIAAALLLTACSSQPAMQTAQRERGSCTDRATSMIASNGTAIAEHRYRAASRVAERAARISLGCGDRWRAANALVVAAELAHQAKDQQRAQNLLARGYALMQALHPPRHATALTSTLMAQRLDTARRDMQGQWAYW